MSGILRDQSDVAAPTARGADDDLEFVELSRAEEKQDQLQNALDREVIN